MDEIEESIEPIIEKYNDEIADLNKRLQDKLEPAKNRLENVWRGVNSEIENFETDAPDKPQSEVHPQDDGWLFDSRRSYSSRLNITNMSDPMGVMTMNKMSSNPNKLHARSMTRSTLLTAGVNIHKKIASIDRHLDYDLRSLGAHSWDARLTSISIYTRASLKKLDSDIADMVDTLICQNDHGRDKE
ncbi:MAG: hypothetical protein MASP_01802 [Candidatus Methanolliviera sp. GoM_asphalt]|nr:MAG: hypothetical protein MASP_01802 [Candidatus Methanolliviera sp. GoM_asphalt]